MPSSSPRRSTTSLDSELTRAGDFHATPTTMTADEAGDAAQKELNSADLEKGREQQLQEKEQEEQRDADGVLVENGIPIVRLTGTQDPDR